MEEEPLSRRQLLHGAVTGLIAGRALYGESPVQAGPARSAMPGGRSVCLIHSPADPIASAGPVRWALGQVQTALETHGVTVSQGERVDQAPAGARCMLAAGFPDPAARDLLPRANLSAPEGPESLALAGVKAGERPLLLAGGSDVRGLVYALLEVADRVEHARDPFAALEFPHPVVERPANPVRSIARLFVSEVEDKPWFYDRAFWQRYLAMLVAQRFNRFSLTFGIGYDFLAEVRDSYLHFAYPFLLDVPGYNVRAVGLPDAERERNFDTLRYIGEAVTAHGLQFQLGLWTHGYAWAAGPGVNYTIAGLTPENHASYCRDALRTLLQACPTIQGVTFRIHGESGVAEGSYDFWKTVFTGVAQSGRRIEIDLHAKGIDTPLIDSALATGMPVNVSPKYWAEHMGLPYHQAAIRAEEMPPQGQTDTGFFALSGGSRRFLRYGYGDLLRQDRRYGVFFRLWPGTQRLLLWGDPKMAAAYGRASAFCDCRGMEICEPLSFKGRKGSGLPGGRDAYADAALHPADDWEKYRYTYHLWGRLLYNPEAPPETWQRLLHKDFGSGAEAAEAALSHASRILPLVTTAHCPSAANNNYWPELYTNMPIVDEKRPHPYGDTPSPKRFGTVSPLDPELFAGIDDFAEELLAGTTSAKIAPLMVAQWLEDLVHAAMHHLAAAEKRVSDRKAPAFRRLAVDVALQSELGWFFASKLRAGVLYALYTRSGDPTALHEALQAYRTARAVWAALAAKAEGVYVPDITFGRVPHLRGHWSDRLAAIDQDIADMEKRGTQPPAPTSHIDKIDGRVQVWQAIRAVLKHTPPFPRIPCTHTPPTAFSPGQPVEIAMEFGAVENPTHLASVHLHFRHINQGERYRVVEMQAKERRYQATLPGDYTSTPYPLQYYFEIRYEPGPACLYPGFQLDLSNQPYFVINHA